MGPWVIGLQASSHPELSERVIEVVLLEEDLTQTEMALDLIGRKVQGVAILDNCALQIALGRERASQIMVRGRVLGRLSQRLAVDVEAGRSRACTALLHVSRLVRSSTVRSLQGT